ncbi:MAG: hypothetical protein HYY16_00680 [Planctomycetes bacterium]|nr:hypothetical protein [Planctomycetota bacterium]
MARVRIQCDCGWVFFTSSDQKVSALACPSCGKLITNLKSKIELAGTADGMLRRRNKTFVVPLSLGGMVVAAALAFGAYSMFKGKDEVTPEPIRPPMDVQPQPVPFPRPRVDETTPNIGVQPPKSQVDHHRKIDHAILRSNIAGIISEIARLDGNSAVLDEMQRFMKATEAEIAASLEELSEKRETHPIPMHLMAGDRIAFFRGKDIARGKPQVGREAMKEWLRLCHVGDIAPLSVNRGPDTLEVTINLTEQTPEVLNLKSRIDLTPESSDEIEPPTAVDPNLPPPVAPLPKDLVANIETKLKALPLYYVRCIPREDRKKAEDVLKTGTGSLEDVEFLRGRYLGLIESFIAEMALFREKIASLEAEALDSTQLDVIYFKGGGKVEGRIVEEADETVKIQGKFGAVRRDRADIERVEKAKGTSAELLPKFQAAKDDIEKLARLIEWCGEKKLLVQQEYLAYVVLQKDPGHPVARKAAKLDDDSPGGATVEEIAAQLKKQGFFEMNGLWCRKQQRTIKIDTLYRESEEVLLELDNAGVVSLTETRSQTVYDVAKKSDVHREITVEKGRFIAPRIPTQRRNDLGQGMVYVKVTSPYDIVECKMKATSQITQAGGSVAVSVALHRYDAAPHQVYTLATVGKNDAAYDISTKVRGVRSFIIKADMVSGLDQTGNSFVRFLPSEPNSRSVLELVLTVAVPLEGPNRAIMDLKTRAAIDKALAVVLKECGDSILDALKRMQEQTRTLKFSAAPAKLPQYADGLKFVSDPRVFPTADLSTEAAQAMANWWSSLSTEDRRGFLVHVALWAAHKRFLKEP